MASCIPTRGRRFREPEVEYLYRNDVIDATEYAAATDDADPDGDDDGDDADEGDGDDPDDGPYLAHDGVGVLAAV